MPELPEVETIKSDLNRYIVEKKITAVAVNDPMVIRSPRPAEFKKRLTGKRVVSVKRRGKAIIVKLAPKGFLIIQLAMTGQLIYGKETKKSRVSLQFLGETFLHYKDQRRFGRLSYTDDLKKSKFLETLGVEPFSADFDLTWLKARLKTRKTAIKNVLMNQNFIAGIGNIYANEILFRCGINPKRRASSLRIKEIKTLYDNILKVLSEAIQLRGSSVNTYRDAKGEKGNFVNRIQVYGRKEEKCFSCGEPIERILLGGRSTFFCRRCQS